jgi:hypothetical protein
MLSPYTSGGFTVRELGTGDVQSSALGYASIGWQERFAG